MAAGTLTEGDLVLESMDYVMPVKLKRPGILYGTIKFSEEFWKAFKVVMYRTDPLGRFFYCPQDLDLTFLAAEHGAWPLQICTTQALLLKAMGLLAAELTTAVYRGSYLPHGVQYQGLKYPVVAKEYLEVSLSSLKDLDMDTGPQTQGSVESTVQTFAVKIDGESETGGPAYQVAEVPSYALMWQRGIAEKDLVRFDSPLKLEGYATHLSTAPKAMVKEEQADSVLGCEAVSVLGHALVKVGVRRDNLEIVVLMDMEGIYKMEKIRQEENSSVVLTSFQIASE